MVKLPGYQSEFNLFGPIIPGGSFSWGEALRWGERMPPSKQIVDNIVAFARQAQKAREHLGEAVIVFSWYRPPEVNASIPNAATKSYHLTGRAMDAYCLGKSNLACYNMLDPWWPGGLGYYADRGTFHIDDGPWGRW